MKNDITPLNAFIENFLDILDQKTKVLGFQTPGNLHSHLWETLNYDREGDPRSPFFDPGEMEEFTEHFYLPIMKNPMSYARRILRETLLEMKEKNLIMDAFLPSIQNYLDSQILDKDIREFFKFETGFAESNNRKGTFISLKFDNSGNGNFDYQMLLLSGLRMEIHFNFEDGDFLISLHEKTSRKSIASIHRPMDEMISLLLTPGQLEKMLHRFYEENHILPTYC